MKTVKVFFLATSLIMASIPVALSKDITRSCKGTVRLLIFTGAPPNAKDLGSITGQGKCGSSAPNKCRERARAQAVKCIDAMWRDRHKNRTAPECKTLVSGRTGAELKWDGIYKINEPGRLTARMAFAACCIMRPNSANLQVRVGGFIIGDKKCGDAKTGKNRFQTDWQKEKYDMDCSKWRDRGICTGGG